MQFFNKNKIINTLLHPCNNNNNNNNNSTMLMLEHKQKYMKKKSIETLDSFTLSNHQSIKNFAKSIIISITDSGISLSRSGSILNSSQNSRKSIDTINNDRLSSNDEEECNRMVAQHYILRSAFDNVDFSAPIIKLLSKKDTVVLDVGCGSGTWTMETATQYPQAQFIGIDKKALFPKHIKPKNCTFQLYEITENRNQVKLPFADASVDFIFQRDLNWGLSESTWMPLVMEYFRILKPGGWLEIVEPDYETYSGSSREDLLVSKLIDSFLLRQQDPFVSKRLSSYMATAGFRRIQSDFKSIPLGWGFQKLFQTKKQKTTFRCSEYARAAANNRLELLQSLQPWFSREKLISKAKYETLLCQLPDQWYKSKAYTNWHRTTAQKRFFN